MGQIRLRWVLFPRGWNFREPWGLLSFMSPSPDPDLFPDLAPRTLFSLSSLLAVLFFMVSSCTEDPVAQQVEEVEASGSDGFCQLDPAYFFSTGVVRDGIPALSQPTFLPGDHADLSVYLTPGDRVVGFLVDGAAFAVPHNILWYHEVANLSLPDGGGQIDLAVTYCPLTGSALVFDRAAVGGAEFGVSGLVYKSNLIMYDRQTQVSLWPQMLAEARCGPQEGIQLPGYPFIEMTWEGWKSLHPETQVLGEIGLSGLYDRYPYGEYEGEDRFGFPMPPPDSRRRPKERVLGVRAEGGPTIAFPFGTLGSLGPWAAVPFEVGSNRTPAVVFWDGERRAAMAYRAESGELGLSFEAGGEGIHDVETGTRWSVGGLGLSGPLADKRLEPVDRVFVAFWGAWHAFFPSTHLWGPGKPLPPTPASPPGTSPFS